MVLISALGKNAIWFCKWISSGVSSNCFAIATPILCRISDAAAFVNVTTSSLSISCPSRKSFVIMRSTRTAVLPLPQSANRCPSHQSPVSAPSSICLPSPFLPTLPLGLLRPFQADVKGNIARKGAHKTTIGIIPEIPDECEGKTTQGFVTK